MNAHCQSVIARSSKFSLKSGPHTIIMKTYQRWLSCLFSVIVAITGGSGSRGVSSTESSCDSVSVGQKPASASRPRHWARPRPEDLAAADGEHGEQEEGEEVVEELHPELCWQGRGQLWTKGQSRHLSL